MSRIAGVGALIGLAALGVLRALAMVPRPRHNGRLPLAPTGPLVHLALHPGATVAAWLFVGMVACYAVVAACGPRVPDRAGLVVIAVLLGLYSVVPPQHAHDVFAYVAYARMGALHGVNPYLHGPGTIPHDPVTGYYDPAWRTLPTKYGPLFTLGSYAVVPLGVMGAAWALKLVTALAAVALLALVAAAAGRLRQDRGSAVRFVGLNPLLLAYAVGNAHNDVLMAAALVAGVALLAAGRDGLGAAAGVISAALKPSALLALPFLVLGAAGRARALAGAAAATLACAAVGAAAFGVPTKLLGTLAGHENASGRHSVPGLLGVHAPAAQLAAFAAAYVAPLALAWRRRLSAAEAAGWAMAAALALSTVVYSWYIAWIVPLAALGQSRRLRVAALVLTAAVTLVSPARSLI
jgi:hypothetical protein